MLSAVLVLLALTLLVAIDGSGSAD